MVTEDIASWAENASLRACSGPTRRTLVEACQAAVSAASADVARRALQTVPRTWTRHLPVPAGRTAGWLEAATHGHSAMVLALHGKLPATLLIALPQDALRRAAARSLGLTPGHGVAARLVEVAGEEVLRSAATAYLGELTLRRLDVEATPLERETLRLDDRFPHDVLWSGSEAPQRLRTALVLARPLGDRFATRWEALRREDEAKASTRDDARSRRTLK